TRKSPAFTDEEINAAFHNFRGDIDQVPPMYSAKKTEGRKLYELARRGIEVDRDPVKVCIYEFDPIVRDGSLIKDNHDGTKDLKVRVSCSGGTYIRTLAEDFGKRLDSGAHLAELRRTRAGSFGIEIATTLEQLKENTADQAIGKVLRPPDSALSHMPF